jgi:uncharacterized protein YkwD
MGRFLALALAISCQGAPTTKAGGVPDLERRMAELINTEREARGIAPFSVSPELSQVARDYSARMAATKEINHDLSRPVEERILEVRPGTCTFGENVSKHTSIDYSLADLLLSPGHRANLLSTQFTEIGIGVVRGDDDFLYITQEFTRPCERRGKSGNPKSKSDPLSIRF